MPLTLTKVGKLTTEERRELKDAETKGFLIAPECAHEELLTRYWAICARKLQTSLVVQPKSGGGWEILIHASTLHAYFDLRECCEAIGPVEFDDSSCGVIATVVDASSAETIAREVTRCNQYDCGLDPPSTSGVPSLDTLAEWILRLPISPENIALIQLLRAGKIRDEREVIDGEEVVMFKSAGAVQDFSGCFARSPSVESALVELFVQGGLDFSLSTRAGRPAIRWRINSSVAGCVLPTMGPPNQ